jgi:hypothetical protein
LPLDYLSLIAMSYQKPVVVPVSKAFFSTAAIAVLLGMGSPNPAIGATVTYDFTVNVPTGTYAGQHTGSFSYDDSTTLVSCTSNGQTTVCAVPSINQLTIRFNFFNKTYNETQDVDYVPPPNVNPDSEYPKVFFPISGAPGSSPSGGLSFLVAPNGTDPGFFILGYDFYANSSLIALNSLTADSLVGQLTYALRPVTPPDPQPGPDPDPQPTPEPTPPIDNGGGDNGGGNGGDDGGAVAVPEPAEIGGSVLAAGLLTLGWYWRRRKVKAIDLDK